MKKVGFLLTLLANAVLLPFLFSPVLHANEKPKDQKKKNYTLLVNQNNKKN